MAATRNKAKSRRSQTERPEAARSLSLRLVGSIDGALANKVAEDWDSPIRETVIRTATECLGKLRTEDIVVLIPVFAQHAAYGESRVPKAPER